MSAYSEQEAKARRKDGLIEAAKGFLKRRGMSDIGHLPVSHASDIVLVAKERSTGATVVAAVMDASKVKSIPMQNLGGSKPAKARFARLKLVLGSILSSAARSGKAPARMDAIWIDDGSNGGFASISHVVGLK